MATMEDFSAYFTQPGSAAERRAAIAAMLGDASDLGPLEPAEAVALMDGFLRGRELTGRPFSSIEMTKLINWGQFTRMYEILLDQLCAGSLGIDIEGPEMVFTVAPAAESVRVAAAFLDGDLDDELARVRLAFAAVRWAEGMPARAEDFELVDRWTRTSRANADLLAAFVAAPDATIDFDARGRVAIYPPERL